jgi:hypothetical protein
MIDFHFFIDGDYLCEGDFTDGEVSNSNNYFIIFECT